MTIIFFSVSTALLVLHMIYGGIFLSRQVKRTDLITILSSLGVATGLIFVITFISNLPYMLLGMIGAFVFAIIYHLNHRKHTNTVWIKEFCNYKIYIELYGIILSVSGLIWYSLFPETALLMGISNLYFVLRLNWLIFFKKRLYQIRFENPVQLHQPLVSIVVISYNEEKYIGNTLKSIAAQTYPHFETILVDDMSTDSTLEIAKSFQQKLSLQIIQKTQKGCSRSRNIGASQAKGDLILFLDSDTILPADFLQKSIQEFNSQKLGIAFFEFKPITSSRLDHLITYCYKLWLKTAQFYNPRGIGFAIMVRKKVHDKTIWDEEIIMSEDFDYVKRAAGQGKFRIITHTQVSVSWRRFEQENRALLLFKYLIFETWRHNIGEHRKELLSYRFGHYK